MTTALNPVAAAPLHTGPVGTYQDWLVAWKEWARTRKRGKMAQFIVDKLEDSKQARWLSIADGKFELTNWHEIAKEWFKEKPRNSDQVDAPCMLRKGLPRAFPGLEEVKGESVKEGTQYRSRVFMAPRELVHEVMMYINNPGGVHPMMASSICQPPATSLPYPVPYQAVLSGQVTAYNPASHQVQSPPQVMSNGIASSPHMYGGYGTPENHPIKLDPDYVDSPSASDTHSPSPYYGMPQASAPGPYISATQSSGNLVEGIDPGLADALAANHHSPGSSTIYSDPPNSASPYQQQPALDVLQLPPGMNQAMGQGMMAAEGGWISPNSHSQNNSPRYSPDPGERPTVGGVAGGVASAGVSYPVNSMGMVMNPQPPPASAGPMAAVVSPPIQPGRLGLKVVPDCSPLEGGGQMVLVFYNELPPGNKFVTFFSRKRNNSITVDTTQENAMVLYALIPRYDMPETVLLQVYCEGCVLAESEFTYYANTQYNSDQLFQYLVQNMPHYFQMDDIAGSMGGGDVAMGGASGGRVGGGGYGYYGNIPASMYGILLGACRLGLEPLVYHTLKLKNMAKINGEQLQTAFTCSQQHGHQNLANCLKHLVRFTSFVNRASPVDSVLGEDSEKYLEKLNTGGEDPLATSHMILKAMVEASQKAKSIPTPSPSPSPSPVQSPAHPSPTSTITTSLTSPSLPSRRVSTTTKLQKQNSVKDPDEDLTDAESTPTATNLGFLGDCLQGATDTKPSLTPRGSGAVSQPGGSGSGPSTGSSVDQELKDSLPPLPRERRSIRGTRAHPFVTTHSDDSDSAVSMSFDVSVEAHDLQKEIDRRMSGSIASSGLFSLIMSETEKAVDVTIDPQASFGFATSLQYEGVFLVTEDYPHGEETIFRSGDRILAVGDTYVRGMSPDSFQELLERQTSSGATKIKVLPRMERSPPPPSSLSLHSLGSSLELTEKKLNRRQSEKQLLDSITLKVSNLLSMKASGKPRNVTITNSSEGYGFKVIGGNAVGLFVSEVKPVRKELCQGDQILEINGQDARHMTHYEASQLLRSCRDKVHLKVMDNGAKFTTIRDQFEFDSFYMRCLGEHKDTSLRHNTVIRVVNTFLFSGHFWLAWIVDENGTDCELRKILSPTVAKQQYGKDMYEEIEGPSSVPQVAAA